LEDGFILEQVPLARAGELATLLRAAFSDPWDEERVRRELGADNGVQAIYGIRHRRQLIATASARTIPPLYPHSGYVHWVGVDPAHRGRSLGKYVTAAVLVYFREAGLEDSVLETDDYRIPAIKTYLGLGFVPEYRTPEHRVRWSKVFRASQAGKDTRGTARSVAS
jgi:mycothiol synthase